MVGYLLVLLVVALNMGESIAVKAYTKKHNSGGFIMNAIIALFACAFFVVKVLISGDGFNFLGAMIPYALINSVFYFCGFYLAYVAFKIGPFGLTRLVASFSLMMPIFYGIFFLNEPTNVFTYLGIALIVAAMVMMNYKGKSATVQKQEGKRFTDTPMWNSTLSGRIAPMTRVDRAHPSYVYYSPVEAESFEGLPPAYIETAEFDCLHDDGILYAEKLREAGVAVTLNETQGTMHGFDIMQKADTTQAALAARIEFMKKVLDRDN